MFHPFFNYLFFILLKCFQKNTIIPIILIGKGKREFYMKDKEKSFVEIKCPKCNAILKFAKEPKNRRVHACCKNCLKEIEVVIK